jgi:hypothetical protein
MINDSCDKLESDYKLYFPMEQIQQQLIEMTYQKLILD